MTISGTYQQMQYQIADELGQRNDLLAPLPGSNLSSSPIQNAIQSAIAYWEGEPFYFNELYDENWFTTVQGQEFYTTTNNPGAPGLPTNAGDGDIQEIASMAKITKVRVLVNNNRYTLNCRTWQYLEDISVNPSVQSEFPIDYAYFGEIVRLYPIPDQALPMTVSGIQRIPGLVNPTDTSIWTQDAYDLIRCQAKLYLAEEVLNDDDLAARMKTALYGDPRAPFSNQINRGYLYRLKAETQQRGAGATIRPTFF
jgi:hypothetical protein